MGAEYKGDGLGEVVVVVRGEVGSWVGRGGKGGMEVVREGVLVQMATSPDIGQSSILSPPQDGPRKYPLNLKSRVRSTQVRSGQV